jgi:hypothetical protein
VSGSVRCSDSNLGTRHQSNSGLTLPFNS